jgi:hypothetical protein
VELLIGWTDTEMDGADVSEIFEGRVGERVHDASESLDISRIAVAVFDEREAWREGAITDRTAIALHPHGRTPVRVAGVGTVLDDIC